jgi:hypothetical protein
MLHWAAIADLDRPQEVSMTDHAFRFVDPSDAKLRPQETNLGELVAP